MKKSYALKWIKALRSGKFKQTTGHLKDDLGHCCLGVLCTLTPYKNNYTKMGSNLDSSLINETLPQAVMKETGIHDSVGGLPNGVCLSKLNDDGQSFEEIADIIERNWKIL